MKKLHGLRFSAWNGFPKAIFKRPNGLSLSGILLIAVVLSLAGCSKNQTPSNDPFSPHPIIPPPGTGGYSTATPDPGYPANAAARTNSSLIPSVSGVPAASGAPNTGYPSGASAPANSIPGYANPNSMPPGYGPAANSGLGSTSSNIIPPPNTLSNGGYPNAAANPGAMPNNYGASVSGASATSNPRAGSSSTLNALINSTPRPTATRSGSPNTSPAASIPGSMASNTAGNRPYDSSQPLRAPSAYDAMASSNPAASNPPTIANNSAAGTPRVPQQGVPSNSIARPSATMPMPPTAYGNPNAVPAYLSSIQSIEEANWIPCDGYADDEE
jgi:hypothetical protein